MALDGDFAGLVDAYDASPHPSVSEVQRSHSLGLCGHCVRGCKDEDPPGLNDGIQSEEISRTTLDIHKHYILIYIYIYVCVLFDSRVSDNPCVYIYIYTYIYIYIISVYKRTINIFTVYIHICVILCVCRIHVDLSEGVTSL